MSGFQDLKDLFRRRLLAAVIRDEAGQTTCGYEEELHRQRKLLDVILTPEIKLRRADVQHLWSPSLDQEDTEPPHIKKEQKELWSNREGKQLQGLEQADTTKFPFTPVSVKSEDFEEKPQSSLLHRRQSDQLETGADGEDCGGAEPARNSDPERHLPPETEESSEPETDDSDDWKETREHQSGLNSVKNFKDKRPKNDKKSHSCSECGKTFKWKRNLIQHMIIHTGEKPFCCSECGKTFNQKSNLTRHLAHHKGEKHYSCSVCDQRFSWHRHLKQHNCVAIQASELHQTQTKLQPETEVKTEDSSEPETEDSDDDWKETREHQSGLNSAENFKDKIPMNNKKSHGCSECGKMFKEKWNMIQHMRIHTGEKPFSCSVCNKTFNHTGHLSSHMRIHTGEKPFSCSVCNKTFNHTGHLNSHMRIHTGEKPFSCSECGKEFNQNGTLTTHMRIHTGEKPFSCSMCSKRFYRRGNLIPHMLVHTGKKPFSCSECGKSFNHKPYLKQHMANHRGEKRYSCSVCDQRFSWHHQLNKHKCVGGQRLELHQNQTEDKRAAETGADGEDCGGPEPVRNSDSERHLPPEIEVKIEDSDDDWMETREHYSGLSSVKNRKHERTKMEKKSHSCSECGKKFKWKRNLIQHMIIHTGEKPFSCFECGKRFNQKSNLTRHLARHMSHTQEIHYSCSVCDQRFSWHRHLKEHKCVSVQDSELHPTQTKLQPETEVKIEDSSEPETEDSEDWKETREHQSGLNSVENFKDKRPINDKKSHSCLECGKTFKKKGNLTIHMRNHTGEKPFCCSVCNKTFNHTGHLSSHMRIHTGEKPFSCSECGKIFNHKSYLKQHMANHRGEKLYSCSVCDQRFSWLSQLKKHKCVGGQPLELHQNQTEDKREAETGADGEDCGGPEPARDSDPERHLQPETEDSSEPEIENSDDDWKETREHQSGLNFNDKRPETDKKSHSCSECGKTFKWKRNMIQHMIIHTGEKPFSCSECGKRFNQKSNLTRHLARH